MFVYVQPKMLLRAFINKQCLRCYATKSNVLSTLKERGLIAQVSEPKALLEKRLERGEKIKLYCGADPTAKSLHLGNLLPLMVLLHFHIHGHDVVTLVGGATGMVGDPSGRKTERDSIRESAHIENVSRINGQLTNFFQNGLKYYKSKVADVGGGAVSHVNNQDWWRDMKMLNFLSSYGRYIRVQSMLQRDSVASRLATGDGLGFNEFTYQILQAYDYYHLYKNENVTVQVGGNDQWGNITAGIDFIGKICPNGENPPFGLTVPLLTTSSGEKFGKSAGNAVFIDPEINTPFDMYQFFINTTDEDVSKLLKIFTFMPLEEIDRNVTQHMEAPQLRLGQKLLAREVVNLIHGPGKGDDAEMVSEVLFGKSCQKISGSELIRVFKEAKILSQCPVQTSLTDLLMNLTDCSKSEARRRIEQGSVYLGPNRTKVFEDSGSLEQFFYRWKSINSSAW